MARIFISYRQEDTAAITGRIFEHLQPRFGDVFMDIEGMAPGSNLRDRINETIDGCDALVAVVGQKWLRQDDGRTDWVELEIAAALRKKLPIVPVLVDHTRMPGPAQLAEDIREFSDIVGVTLDAGIDFRNHMERLIAALDGIIASKEAPASPPSGRVTAPVGPTPEARFVFEGAGLLAASFQSRLQQTTEGYIAYLDSIGFPPRPFITLNLVKLTKPNAYYENETIFIDIRMSGDVGVALREYAHHVLLPKGTELDGELASLESGLADYFPASFLKNAKVGEITAGVMKLDRPYLRDLDNKRAFRRWTPSDAHQDLGEIWGGAFWDMLRQLDSSRVDPVLAKAWLAVLKRRARQKTLDVAAAFVGEVLSVADKRSAPKLRRILQGRKFPVCNRAQGDCPRPRL